MPRVLPWRRTPRGVRGARPKGMRGFARWHSRWERERAGWTGRGLRGGGRSAGDSGMGREVAMSSKEKTPQAKRVAVRVGWGKGQRRRAVGIWKELGPCIPRYLALSAARGGAWVGLTFWSLATDICCH